MEYNIPDAFVNEESLVVEKQHTAMAYGSGLAEVFATPVMVALMENAAYKGIERFLPNGFSSVGTEINVQHLQATLPGKTVKAISKVTETDGRKVSFEVKVFEEGALVGTCTHKRFIVETEKFLSNL